MRSIEIPMEALRRHYKACIGISYYDIPFGDKIRKLREIQRLAICEAAKLTGIPRTTLSHYERGRATPAHKEIVFAMASVYKYDANDLMVRAVQDIKLRTIIKFWGWV